MIPAFHRLAGGLRNLLSRDAKPAPEPAQAMARPGIEFMAVQRRIRIYLRALWDADFTIEQATYEDGEHRAGRPFVADGHIHLPQAFDDWSSAAGAISGLDTYRAAAAHAAVHLLYSTAHFSPRSLDPWQIAVISAIEDARVETLALRRFPGLRQLWARQHQASPQQQATAGDYLNRLARALLDDGYRDDDPWIGQGRELFAAADPEDAGIARSIGLRLAESLRQQKLRFDPGADAGMPPYRDDNLFLWQRPGKPIEVVNPYFSTRTLSRHGKRVKYPQQNKLVKKKLEGEQANAHTFFYPEWNYRSQKVDHAWVTLRETEPEAGEPKVVDDILAEHSHALTRMKNLLLGIRDGDFHRIRKLEEGDEVDLDAAIRAQVDIRLGMRHDPRVMMRTARKRRDISVLMLLDLSSSMNGKVHGQEHTALQLTQQVSALFAAAMDSIGDPFAIHGFSSASRHNVEYFAFKNFDQPYDEAHKARIAGMSSHLGTRMGAAIRHAAHHLNRRKSSRKLLLILSDGAPSDIDVPDQKYLRDDTKKAVEDARKNGIHTYCISLDPQADEYVSRLFGARNYRVVDHIRSLPEKVLQIYAGLSR